MSLNTTQEAWVYNNKPYQTVFDFIIITLFSMKTNAKQWSETLVVEKAIVRSKKNWENSSALFVYVGNGEVFKYGYFIPYISLNNKCTVYPLVITGSKLSPFAKPLQAIKTKRSFPRSTSYLNLYLLIPITCTLFLWLFSSWWFWLSSISRLLCSNRCNPSRRILILSVVWW